MVTYEIESRRRHERRELFHGLERIEGHMGRSVAPRALETAQQAAVGQQRETLGGDRRARAVAGEPLQALAIVRGHTDVGVDADAGRAGTPGAGRDGKVLDIDSISDGRDTTAGTRARGDAPWTEAP